MTEIQLQAACFQTAWNNYPQTRRLLFHPPNGGARTRIEASQLKASGVIAGIPDLLLLWKGCLYAWELKAENGKLSPDQVKVHAAWAAAGVEVLIVRTKEVFLADLEAIVGPPAG